MCKFSIIVPVYNTQHYIDRCIESLVNQTYTNTEIILVDDGSPDKSGEICDIWAQKNHRIKVIHKPNGGVSSARNAGLDAASGDYVAFIDSDDTVKTNWLSDLATLNEDFNADLITFGTEKISDGNITATESMPTFYADGRAELSPYFSQFFNDIFGSVCTKIYKLSIIKSNHLRFDETLSINEDAFFDYAFIPLAVKFINCENCYYQYYYYKNSSSNKGRDDMAEVFMRRMPVHDEFVKKMGYGNIDLPTGEDMLSIGIFLQYVQAVTSTNNFTFSNRTKILKSLYSNKKFKSYIINEISKQPPSFAFRLGLFSLKLNCPYIISVPVALKKLLSSR